MASVQERVIDIVASQLGVSKDQITLETSFINIPDEAAEKIQTVGQAVEFIEKNQS